MKKIILFILTLTILSSCSQFFPEHPQKEDAKNVKCEDCDYILPPSLHLLYSPTEKMYVIKVDLNYYNTIQFLSQDPGGGMIWHSEISQANRFADSCCAKNFAHKTVLQNVQINKMNSQTGDFK